MTKWLCLIISIMTFSVKADLGYMQTNPILLFGGVNIEAQYKFSEKITGGVGYYNYRFHFSHSNETKEFKLYSIKFNYWFSEAMKKGLLLSTSYNFLQAEAERDVKSSDDTLHGKISTSGLALGIFYRWLRNSFFIEVGYEFEFYNDLEIKLESNSTNETDTSEGLNPSGVQINTGWNF